MHCSIWNVLTRDDSLAKWLSIMMSLPFMYGFVSEQWTHEVCVMIKKKSGVRKIHQLRIIGILDTTIKLLFA